MAGRRGVLQAHLLSLPDPEGETVAKPSVSVMNASNGNGHGNGRVHALNPVSWTIPRRMPRLARHAAAASRADRETTS